MRILTHNMLCCLKCDHFPLKIKAKEKLQDEQEEDLKFVVHMLPKIDYDALKAAAKDLDIAGLPDQLPENIQENTVALKALHRLLVDVSVKEGDLECSNCGRTYNIKNGIPNMTLNEAELEQKKKLRKDIK